MNGYKHIELLFASVLVPCVFVCLNETVLRIRPRSEGQNFSFLPFVQGICTYILKFAISSYVVTVLLKGKHPMQLLKHS
jgi:hypothetical protein